MDNRLITCTNEDGISLYFGVSFSPFILESVDGVYSIKNKVSTVENTMIDGSTYQGSVAEMRNIVLYLRDKDSHKFNRELLYRCFKIDSKGQLKYTEDGTAKIIDYYVESISVTGDSESRRATISLLCPDPFFYDERAINVYLAEWNPSFKFIHEFKAIKEEIGYRSLVKIQNIVNETAADDIGITIQITAKGTVKNPKIIHVESNKVISIGSEDKPLVMSAGDVVTISTVTGNKHVYLLSGGVQTEINHYLTESSEYFQLLRGNNHIGYDADGGLDNISIQITYRLKYSGV